MADETITIDVNDTSDGTPDRPSEVTSQSSTDAPNEALQRTLDELAGLQRDRNAATATDSGGIEADFDAFHAFNDSLGEAAGVVTTSSGNLADGLNAAQAAIPESSNLEEANNELAAFNDVLQSTINNTDTFGSQIDNWNSLLSDLPSEPFDFEEANNELAAFSNVLAETAGETGSFAEHIDNLATSLEARPSNIDIESAQAELDGLTSSLQETSAASDNFSDQTDALNAALHDSAAEYDDAGNVVRTLATEASGLEAAFDAMREAAEGGGDDEQENHAKGLARTGVQVLSLGRAMGLVSTKVAATAAAGIALTAGLVTVTGGLVLLAAGVVGAIFGMIAFNKVITKVADDIKGFSPATMAAKIDQTITALENKIKLAQVAGDEVGGVVDAQTSFQTEASELFRTVIDAFAPLLTIIINILAIIFDLFNQIAKPILDWMGTIVDLMTEIFIWILEIASRMWFIGGKAQEILDKMTKDPERDDMLGKHIQGLFNPRNVGFREEHKAKQDERQEHFDEVVDRPRP